MGAERAGEVSDGCGEPSQLTVRVGGRVVGPCDDRDMTTAEAVGEDPLGRRDVDGLPAMMRLTWVSLAVVRLASQDSRSCS